MAEIIIMPKLGFNMSEGKLVEWYKQEGDTVAKGENLFSIETDKTNMDIERRLTEWFANCLSVRGPLPVILPIAIVGDADEDISALLADAEAQLGGSAPASSGEEERCNEVPKSEAPASQEAAGEAAVSVPKGEEEE